MGWRVGYQSSINIPAHRVSIKPAKNKSGDHYLLHEKLLFIKVIEIFSINNFDSL
jgi:hypothetical protein